MLMFLLLPATSVFALYDRQSGADYLSVQGFVTVGGGYADYPDDNFLYTETDTELWNTTVRLLAEAGMGDNTVFNLNLYQNIHSAAPLAQAFISLLPKDTERSALFTWEQHDSVNSRSEMTVDVLHARYLTPNVDITIGRQPVNLATTFYFTPNDFFAPFAARTFFRNYKAGVDALRGEIRLANLSQLTLLGVTVYNRDPDSANGWSNSPDWSETSFLGRYTKVILDCELGLLAGTVHDYTVSGGSFQGEIFNWLGIRAEGHYAHPEKQTLASKYAYSLGVEHRYANSLDVHLEFARYSAAGSLFSFQVNDRNNYTALGISYEFTPLLNGTFLTLVNLDDDSQLYSVYAVYSLSDESEAALTISMPNGDEPDFRKIPSQYGASPQSVLLEYRIYF